MVNSQQEMNYWRRNILLKILFQRHRPQQGNTTQNRKPQLLLRKEAKIQGIPVIGWLKGLPVMAWGIAWGVRGVLKPAKAPRMRTTSKNHQGDDLYFLVGNLQKNLHGGAVPI